MDGISGGQVQRKLKVGPANDKYEQEADQMADRVMRSSEPAVQRKCSDCEAADKQAETPVLQKKEMPFAKAGGADESTVQSSTKSLRKHLPVQTKLKENTSSSNFKSNLKSGLKVQRKEEDDEIQRFTTDRGRGPPMGNFTSSLNQSKGSGSPMDNATNSFMSSRFGADFSNVKIHTDSSAARMSNSINAKAFTHQNHIYFNQGQYQPNTHEGKTLLAHELTHTIQQGAVGSSIQAKLKLGSPNDQYEKEADQVADAVTSSSSSGNVIQTKTWDKEEEYNPYATATKGNMPEKSIRRMPLQNTVMRKCKGCEEETIQRGKQIDQERGPPNLQRKSFVHTVSSDASGNIQRGFWDDPLGSIGNAISDAADAVADTLDAGIDWIKEKVADMAANMPGYRLFTVVIGKDPITDKTVEQNGRNFIEAGLDIIPDGKDYKQKLEKDGTLEKAAKWLDDQIKLLDFSVSDIIADFGRFVGSLSASDVASPQAALDRGIKIFKPYVDKVITFAENVAIKFLEIVKEVAINALLEWIQKQTNLYPLLTLVLGEDPLSGEVVERNGKNILTAIILLQSNGQEQLTKMTENGALQKGAEWVDETIAALVEIIGNVTEAFTSLWTEFKIADFLTPTETFTKIYEKFSKPVIQIKDFIVRVGTKILEIVRDIVVNELLEWIKKETVWYPLITVVLGEDPISGQKVERNGMNLIKGFAALHPEGEEQVRQMEESGALQKAADWIDTSIERVINIIVGLRNGFVELWETFEVTDLLYPTETFKTIYNLFSEPVSEMISFALEVAIMILKFIKDALIRRLVEFAKTIPGYNLVTVILGKDIFSQDPVERSAENIIRGFMGLVPGGEEKFQELKQTGVIGEAIAWIEGAIEELDLTWDAIRGLFTTAWNEFSLADLATPIETFGRVMDLFAAPVGRVIRFVGKVVIKLVEIALRLMGFPFELIGSIISRAQTAYEEIKNDPIGFLKNILAAVKLGFEQFFGNILKHLLKGVGDWLFGQLGDAGITIPTDFSFKSILGLVFEILGITKEKIFEKLKKKVGPEKWEKIEGAIDKMTGVWEFVTDIVKRGPIVIWEKIQEKLNNLWDMVISAARNWIMTKIIEQVTVKLLSMLDPTGIMAVVNSFIAFFKAVQSAIEYMIPMLEMLNSFLGGVVQIAQGNIKPAADLLEQTMSKGMPILIGFLANQVGLGSIGKKIKEIIESIQAKVDEGIQWLIDKAWELGARMLDGIKGALGLGDDKNGKMLEGQAGAVWKSLEPICEKELVEEGQVTKILSDQTRKERGSPEAQIYKLVKTGKQWYVEAKGNKGVSKAGPGSILSTKGNKFYFTTNDKLVGLGDDIVKNAKAKMKANSGDQAASSPQGGETQKFYNNKKEQAKVVEKEGQQRLDALIKGVNFKITLEEFKDVESDKKITVDYLVEPNATEDKDYLDVTDQSQIGIYIFYKDKAKEGKTPHVIIKTKTGADASSELITHLKIEQLSQKKVDDEVNSWVFGANPFKTGDLWQEKFNAFVAKLKDAQNRRVAVPARIESLDSTLSYQSFIPVPADKLQEGQNFQRGQIGTTGNYGPTFNCVTHPSNVVKRSGVNLPNNVYSFAGKFAAAVTEYTNLVFTRLDIPGWLGDWGQGRRETYDGIEYVLDGVRDHLARKLPQIHNELNPAIPKLKHVNQISPEEKEADSIAAQIVGAPIEGKLSPVGRGVQRKMKPSVKRGNGLSALSGVEAPKAGNRIDKSTQQFMEAGFGADFSGVRVHTDRNAVQMSEAIQARAFTHGNNIYFNSGQYNPNTREGKRLLAHELTHTVQQGGAKTTATIQRQETEEPQQPSISGLGVLYQEDTPVVTLFARPLFESAPENRELPVGTKVIVFNQTDGFYAVGLYNDAAVTGYVDQNAIVQARQDEEGNVVVENEVEQFDKETFETNNPDLAEAISGLYWNYHNTGGFVESLKMPEGYDSPEFYMVADMGYWGALRFEQARRRAIEGRNNYSAKNIHIWLGAVDSLLVKMATLLAIQKNGGTKANEAEFELAYLKDVVQPELEMMREHPYLGAGKNYMERRSIQDIVEALEYEQSSPAEKALPTIISFVQANPVVQGARAELVTYGALMGQLLATNSRISELNRNGFGLSADQIREVFMLLQLQNTVLAEQAMYGGETIGWLVDHVNMSGFGDLRASGEGLLSGIKRGYYEEMNTSEPAPFDQWGILDATTFYLWYTLGVPSGLALGAKDLVVGLYSLFTPSFWQEMYRIFTDEAHRFEIGVGLGTAIAKEIRTYQSGDPATIGWKLGILMGRIAFEIIFTLLTSGAFQLSKVEWAAKFPRLARIAESVASSKVGQIAAHSAVFIIGKLDDIARTVQGLLQRLPALTASQRMNRQILKVQTELELLLEAAESSKALAQSERLEDAASSIARLEEQADTLGGQVTEIIDMVEVSEGNWVPAFEVSGSGMSSSPRQITGPTARSSGQVSDGFGTTGKATSRLDESGTGAKATSSLDELEPVGMKEHTPDELAVDALLNEIDDRQLPVPASEAKPDGLSVMDESMLPSTNAVDTPTLTWNDIQTQAKGLGLSTEEVSALWKNYKIENGIPVKKQSARARVGASNSQLTSAWKQDLYYYWEMKGLARQTPSGAWEFLDIHSNKWLPASHFDLGHKVAAVEFYQLIRTRPLAEQKRLMYTFMRNFDNYRPELSSANRSAGASLGITYDGPNPGYRYGESSRMPIEN